jgi:ribosomal protein S18 acetylase RimI-like enzyme
VTVRPSAPDDRGWVNEVIAQRWGGIVAMHDELYAPSDLPGLVAELEGQRVGLLTYRVDHLGLEVVTVDALLDGVGAGTALVCAARNIAQAHALPRMWLVTTNDNVHALWFYQRLGMRVTRVDLGAVDRARLLKPDIPMVGHDGIPIRDELTLEVEP